MRTLLLATAAIIGLASGAIVPSAEAAYLPVGIQNNVSLSTVENTWGWTLIDESNYGSGVAISDLFSGHGQYVMLGAMLAGSGVISILAETTYTDATTFTAVNQTNTSNGAQWYFNDYSMGFAGLGDTIAQNNADVSGSDANSRLSWHTSLIQNSWQQNTTDVPLYVYNGWRAGSVTGIYTGTNWDRVVFTADSLGNDTPVPEPATLTLLGASLVGLAAARRRKANAA